MWLIIHPDDDSIELFIKNIKVLYVIKLPKNIGYAKAYNYALKKLIQMFIAY